MARIVRVLEAESTPAWNRFRSTHTPCLNKPLLRHCADFVFLNEALITSTFVLTFLSYHFVAVTPSCSNLRGFTITMWYPRALTRVLSCCIV